MWQLLLENSYKHMCILQNIFLPTVRELFFSEPMLDNGYWQTLTLLLFLYIFFHIYLTLFFRIYLKQSSRNLMTTFNSYSLSWHFHIPWLVKVYKSKRHWKIKFCSDWFSGFSISVNSNSRHTKWFQDFLFSWLFLSFFC